MGTLPKSLQKAVASGKKRGSTPKVAQQKVAPRKARSIRKTVVPAAEAKTHLLELLDTVDRERASVTITKRGRAVAMLVPIEEKPVRSIFGYMKGTFRITGDIVGPEPDVWEAMSE